jgi:HAMP domain-containing protein
MKLTLWVIVAIALFLGGGFAFLSTWRIPAPTSQIEQVIPNDKFPR